MHAEANASTMPDARPLDRLIGRTRTLLRSSWVATGLGLTVGLLLGSLVVLAVLDLFVPLEPITLPIVDVVVPLDPILRCVALALVVVPAVLALIQGVLRPLLRRLRPTLVARRIESRLPGIHNRLVSAIDLRENPPPAGVSPVFLRRLLTEALERIRNFRAGSVLDLVSLRRAALAAALAIGLAAIAWALFSDRLPTALARIFNPLADIPPASGIAYRVEPGTADVLRNEEIPFTVRVDAGEPAGLRLELYSDGRHRPRRFDLKRDSNDPAVWHAVIDAPSLGAGFEDSFRYRVYGGRTWTTQHRIRLVDRPVIAGVETAVYYPKYMKIPDRHPTPPQAVAVAGPEGGSVEVVLQSQNEVASGDIQLLESTIQRIPRERQQERAFFEDKPPVGATIGGTWSWLTAAGRKVHTEPASPGTVSHWYQGDPVGVVAGTGDVLFTHVYLPAGSSVETLMLEWHDGDGWEHRAFWGADRIAEGKPNSSSRHRVGDLPKPGGWVRLEVPAARVGLEGRTVRGVAFKSHGGPVFWGRAGSVQIEEPGLKVVKSFPLAAAGEDRWAGRFPLVGSGLFRAELRNPQGHPSKPMKEIQYVSLPDRPPYVALDRKNHEATLSQPTAIPLSVVAFDDYGLDFVRVLTREGGATEFRARTLWSAGTTPKRTLTLETQLNESAELPTGGVLRYLIEAQDTKGQTARTQEFVVRIAADPAAADQQLANFDRTQDSFQDRLAKLLAEQKKVKEKVDELNKENAQLTEKLDKIKEETPPGPKEKADATKPEEEKKPATQLTPEEQKRLDELRKELAKLGDEENKVAQHADQFNQDLKRATEEANKLDLLPKPVANEMAATQRAFEDLVANAMKNLGKDLKDSGDPQKKDTPDLNDLKGKSDRVDKELEGIKNRLDALSDARKGLKEDVQKTLDALRDRMAREDAKLSARDLEDLKQFLDKLREQLKNARGKQDELSEQTEANNDAKAMKGKQEDLDRQLKDLLAQAKKLLDKSDADRPEFPDTPFRDDRADKAPPREQDSDEPLPKKDKDANKADGSDAKADDKSMDDDENKKFMPRLGGPREKLDPRYAGKQRPMKPKNADGKDENDDKEKLLGQQNENARDLDAAEKSLKSDQNTLDNLLQQLGEAGKPKPEDGAPDAESSEAQQMADQLRAMMQSKALREALAMAAAAKLAARQQGQQQGKDRPKMPPTPTRREVGNMEGGLVSGAEQAALEKLDPATRAMILKLPPSRYREELIRGLNEQGPEAYRAFIQDYFKRLTEAKKR